MKHLFFAKALGFMLLLSVVSGVAMAGAGSQKHPSYLHALSDLRAARWMIKHRPGNWAVTQDESEAIRQIDAAISEIKKAAIDDGKDVDDHIKVDERNDRKGRLREANDFMKKARKDISHDEDNSFAQGLQARAYNSIDAAINAINHALNN